MTSAASACAVCQLHAESTFSVEGMDCREEVQLIERRFKHLAGLEDFTADVVGRRLHVKYDAAKLSTSAIAAAVAEAGMRAWLEHEEGISVEPRRDRRLRHLLLVGSGLALFGGLLAPVLAGAHLSRVFFAVSLLLGAPTPLRRARHAVALRTLDINVLMLVAACAAVLLGEWSEAAGVVFLFALAQALEARTLERARLAVRALLDLAPTQVVLREGPTERSEHVERVRPGAIIIVKPGEKFPLDGRVLAGVSTVNQAPVTGESMPADKRPGDEVFAGTINGRGALDVEVTRRHRDTTLSRIIHLVERAQASRAPVQAFVERFARVYTPAVLALSATIAVVPPLLGGDVREWVYRALVLLVISCPCALVISTPVSVVAALAGAARRGVLIKGGVHLERASRVRCVAFDKTGTLTRGEPVVVDVSAFNGQSTDRVLALAAALERRSEHPIAEAIVREAERRRVPVVASTDVVSLPGRGVEGRVPDGSVLLGNLALFRERGLDGPELTRHVADLGEAGHTAVLVAEDGRVVGAIAVADRARESARDALDLLRRQGVECLVMLTGDSEAAAREVARTVGVDELKAGLMPEDKVSAIEDLRRRYGAVAMVGDGVNDAPALASADLGIAMGAAGSDAALETADVALMADELLKIPYAFRVSRSAMRNIKTNLAVSLVLKAAFVIATIAGVASLWMAVLADTGASMIVVANALRLLRHE